MAKVRGPNEGTIRKRKDGRFEGRIITGRKPDGNYKVTSVYGTQAEVIEKLNVIKGNLRNQTYADPSKLLLGEWVREWLDSYMKNNIKNSTWLSYDVILRRHIDPEIGGIKLSKLQTADLQKLYNSKLKTGRADTRKVNGKIVTRSDGLSPRTIRYIHQVIHGALKQAKKENLISVNVAENVLLPINPKKEMKHLSTDEIKTFLDTARKSRYYTAYLLELFSGLRRGELLALRWQDIDINNKKISVIQQLVVEGGQHIIRELKTASSRRSISLPDLVVSALEQHRKDQIDYIRDTLSYDDIQVHKQMKDGLVFINEIGGFIQPHNFIRNFKIVLNAANLKDIRFHDMRHSFALLSLEQGVDIKTLQSDLGHTSIKTTLDHYGHVNANMKKEAANKRGELLKRIINE